MPNHAAPCLSGNPLIAGSSREGLTALSRGLRWWRTHRHPYPASRAVHSVGGKIPSMLRSKKISSKRICDLTVSVPPACPAPGKRVSMEKTLLEVRRLVTHLQNAAELKDTALAHELHDELGGLMGAAVMDLDSVRRVKPALSQNAFERVDRVKKTLQQAIDLKRRLIEELRPSILDNFGLFAALRWQLKKTWGNSAVVSSETYPDIEPEFESGAPIALFRIAQEALSIALMRVALKSTDLTVRADSANFSMTFSDDGRLDAKNQSGDRAMLLASMRHRIRILGGKLGISDNDAGVAALTVWMPLRQASTAVDN
jgi:signal transduction histidine kinase